MYQHSEVFAKLKATKEVKTNFTSYQWLSTLDFFIESAMRPIVFGDRELVNSFVAKVLAFATLHKPRKFYTSKREESSLETFNFLAGLGDPTKALSNIRLNRGILLALLDEYPSIVRDDLIPHQLDFVSDRRAKLARASPTAFLVQRESAYWYSKALEFRAHIINKYTRHALMQAKTLYEDLNHSVPLDDLVQSFLICLARAIDRCDSNLGVLSTFISNWFLSVRSTYLRDAAVKHANLDDFAHLAVSSSISEEHILRLSRNLDPEGTVRFALGIPNYLD